MQPQQKSIFCRDRPRLSLAHRRLVANSVSSPQSSLHLQQPLQLQQQLSVRQQRTLTMNSNGKKVDTPSPRGGGVGGGRVAKAFSGKAGKSRVFDRDLVDQQRALQLKAQEKRFYFQATTIGHPKKRNGFFCPIKESSKVVCFVVLYPNMRLLNVFMGQKNIFLLHPIFDFCCRSNHPFSSMT